MSFCTFFISLATPSTHFSCSPSQISFYLHFIYFTWTPRMHFCIELLLCLLLVESMLNFSWFSPSISASDGAGFTAAHLLVPLVSTTIFKQNTLNGGIKKVTTVSHFVTFGAIKWLSYIWNIRSLSTAMYFLHL